MKKVILIGTSHTIQRGDGQKNSFYSYVEQLCRTHKVKAIAEEIDIEQSVAKNVSSSLGIRHKIIEPTPNELEGLGIEQVHKIEYQLMSLYDIDEWPENPEAEVNRELASRIQDTYRKRELEWLKRINELDIWPVLIICGASHYEPFYKLLVSSGIDVVKEESKWGL